MTRRLAVLILCGAVLVTAPLRAQNDPRLRAAVDLARSGNRDSARVIIRQVQQGTAPDDPLRVETLYTSAILASDPDTMRLALQQIIVEHALSPWADDALLQLAELDYASGNLAAAKRDLERFRTDFPSADVFAEASFWAARTWFDARDEHTACEWVGMGLARVSDSAVTVRDQLQDFARRCPATVLAEGSASAPPAPPRDTIVVRPIAADTAPAPVVVDTTPVVAAPPVVTAQAAPDTVVSSPVSPPPAPPPDPGVLRVRLDTTTTRSRPAPSGPVFRVQLVAANTAAAAAEVAKRAEDLGYETRTVQEGGYYKVRAGRFTTRADATAAANDLRADFPGAFLVRDQ